MFEQYLKQIQREAISAYPNEAVWLITPAGCRQVENVHEHPDEAFAVRESDSRRAQAEGLLAVVHSHPKTAPVPSSLDMQGQVNTGVPWGVLSVDSTSATGITWWGHPEVAPLIGRPFCHGVTDCYALVRDYYLVELGIRLPEYPRDWRWWEHGANLLEEGFAAAGFLVIDVSEARPGDVWVAQIGGRVPNHVGILLENDLALHQIGSGDPIDSSRPSAREPIYRYLRFVVKWLRHKDLDQ